MWQVQLMCMLLNTSLQFLSIRSKFLGTSLMLVLDWEMVALMRYSGLADVTEQARKSGFQPGASSGLSVTGADPSYF